MPTRVTGLRNMKILNLRAGTYDQGWMYYALSENWNGRLFERVGVNWANEARAKTSIYRAVGSGRKVKGFCKQIPKEIMDKVRELENFKVKLISDWVENEIRLEKEKDEQP